MRIALVWASFAAALFAGARPGDAPARPTVPARLRRPGAVLPVDEGRHLIVANHQSGTLSMIDVNKRAVVGEVEVGRSLADVIATPDGRLVAVDDAAGEMVLLARSGELPSVTHRIGVGTSPVSVCVAAGSRAVVACMWPRLLAVVELPAGAAPRIERTISLPVAPRLQVPLPGGDRVVVADTFGGNLAVVDVRAGKVESVRKLPGHNIRGMAWSADGKELWLAHQILTEETPAREDEVRWGNVISNVVRSLSMNAVARPGADLLQGSRLYPLGEFQHGAADPGGLAAAPGKVVVAVGGTGELAAGPVAGKDWPRLRVGQRPTAVALRADGGQAYVANTFSDSISIVDLGRDKKVAEVPLGSTPKLDAARRGEVLFFDGRLSKEKWMSCHSCHSDGHTNGLRSDTLGDGSYGAPKRVPTLHGVGTTGPWAWNGSMATLKDQIRQSIRTTMNGRAREQEIDDLEAYLRTLPPPPTLPRPTAQALEAIRHGQEVFTAHGCARCHAPPTYTTPRTYEVGLVDEMGKADFNPPSLRGVVHGTAFFHDGRATRLEEVFTRFAHQVPRDLARRDLDDLLEFLRSL
jgi:YVTN family beta-propeller protein